VRLPAARVRRYVRVGLVQPSRVEGREVLFGEPELARLRKIRRLSDDLGLNPPSLEIVLHLLDEIESLRAALEPPGTNGASAPETEKTVITQGGATWRSTSTS
jgi:MerR family transcriptional regulator/heat shock protein HspR